MKYVFESPKTPQDYELLLSMKSTTLTKIETWYKTVDGEKQKTVGIFFYFKDRTEPISFGKEGKTVWAAEFNENQRIKTIKLSTHIQSAKYGDSREIYFYDTSGIELAKWMGSDGNEYRSRL